ncbi:uncharacterized protein A4U43_C10F3480 [Asparagus officinalis]|uniref:Uncharacterized protein n=1 Tax=Asparagus officinalis TaxID=4686 RepID=A0A5P1E3F7_ASPOF|nr:uncharacterized protein A4U43_C10F3480 [Asparagus officinalis]
MSLEPCETKNAVNIVDCRKRTDERALEKEEEDYFNEEAMKKTLLLLILRTMVHPQICLMELKLHTHLLGCTQAILPNCIVFILQPYFEAWYSGVHVYHQRNWSTRS